jgi:hypothetical protein
VNRAGKLPETSTASLTARSPTGPSTYQSATTSASPTGSVRVLRIVPVSSASVDPRWSASTWASQAAAQATSNVRIRSFGMGVIH